MAKLRLVKERVRGTEDYDQDLRGLGEELSVTEATPLTILSVELNGSKETLLKAVKSINFCSFNIIEDKNCFHIGVQNQIESAKEQATYLYVLSMILSKYKFIESMSMWVADRFRFHLTNSIKLKEPENFSPEKIFDYKSFFQRGSLKVMAPISIYLHQAGFQNFHSECSSQIFSIKELNQHLASELQREKQDSSNENKNVSKVG